jgi:hypothetical protein
LNEAHPSITPEKPLEKTVYSIRVLRGLAALLVMFFHYSHYLKLVIPGAEIGYQRFDSGYVGSKDPIKQVGIHKQTQSTA